MTPCQKIIEEVAKKLHKTNGQIVHRAFFRKMEMLDDEQIDDSWNNSSDDQRNMYEDIAQAVIDAQPCQHAWFDLGYDPEDSTYAYKCKKCGKEL